MVEERKAPGRGLGRGLGALIQSASRLTPAGVDEVPIDSILPNPYQPRRRVESAQLRELAESVSQHGLLQPLLVTLAGDLDAGGESRYRLIAGARRLEAAKLAGRTTVPVVVKEATPGQMLEMALVENIQRADLNPLEEAAAYQQLVSEFGLTQEQVAARVGRSRTAVTNALRLLALPEEVKAALSRGEITEGHARALLALPGNPQRLSALLLITERGLSVRQTEEVVRRILEQGAPREMNPRSAETRALEEVFRNALGTRVNLFRGRRGGKLVIHFYSDEELQGLYDLLVKSE